MFNKFFQSRSFWRYCLIGLAAFLIDFGLLQLFLRTGIKLVLANSLSTAIAIIFSFLLHRHFSFQHIREIGYHFNVTTQSFLFVLANLLSIVFNTGIVVALVYWSLSPAKAKVIASAILLIWNYFISRKVTFKVKIS